jgi:hypothetical protein
VISPRRQTRPSSPFGRSLNNSIEWRIDGTEPCQMSNLTSALPIADGVLGFRGRFFYVGMLPLTTR